MRTHPITHEPELSTSNGVCENVVPRRSDITCLVFTRMLPLIIHQMSVNSLTYVFNLLLATNSRAEIRSQCAVEQFQQDLEADLGKARVVTSLAHLIANEGICDS